MDSAGMNSKDVLKELWAIKSRTAEPVPKGYKSMRDWAKEWGVHLSTARVWLQQMDKVGKIKKVKLRFFDGRRIQMKYFYGK
jgi:hypothetical protein